MAAGLAWVLNLDADLELAAFASGAKVYAPTDRVLAAMRPHVEALARALVDRARGDVVVDERSAPGVARGRAGRAFCPTPRALSLLRRAGAEPEPHPPVEVLARVNGRAFASALGDALPGAGFVSDLDGAIAKLATAPPPRLATAWRVKRAHGMAGRGHRVFSPGSLCPSDLAFLAGAMKEGGVQIEPQVAIVEELALHGLLGEDGSLRLGHLVRQRCDARGQWLATERAVDADAEQATAFEQEARRVARALHDARYFGPFGIDGFTYREREGGVRLRTQSEVNARYGMGSPTGLGPVGPEER